MNTPKKVITLMIISSSLLINQSSIADVASGDSRAHLVVGLNIFQAQELNFGNILPDTSGDTILLSHDSIESVTGNSTLNGGHSHAIFSVYGESSTVVNIQITSETALEGSGTSMAVNNFTTQASLSPTLNSSGYYPIKVGASLSVNASQTPGVYTGSYSITVSYN